MGVDKPREGHSGQAAPKRRQSEVRPRAAKRDIPAEPHTEPDAPTTTDQGLLLVDAMRADDLETAEALLTETAKVWADCSVHLTMLSEKLKRLEAVFLGS